MLIFLCLSVCLNVNVNYQNYAFILLGYYRNTDAKNYNVIIFISEVYASFVLQSTVSGR